MGIWDNSDGNGGQALVAVRTQTAAGQVVDITGDVLHPDESVALQLPGRRTEFDQIEPGYVDLVLGNDSGDYTPGVPSAAVMLTQGMPLWWRETVGRRSFDLFAGALSQPTATFQNLPDGVGDRVAATANDWMGQQADGGRTFISNLSEHIIFHGGSTLRGFWPMTESARPWRPAVNTSTMPDISTSVFKTSAAPPNDGLEVTPATGVMPPGEDARTVVIGGPLDPTGAAAYDYHAGVIIPGGIPLAVGEVLTVVLWVQPTLTAAQSQYALELTLSEATPSGASAIDIYRDVSTGRWVLQAVTGALTGTITGPSALDEVPYPIVVRYAFNPRVFELWVGPQRTVGSLSGTAAGSMTLFQAYSKFFWQGLWGYLQVYVGQAADWTFADYLAQLDIAGNKITSGYGWQRTDERIRLLAKYAGLTDAQLDLERGTAWMPRASIAGSTFIAEAQAAVDTEQGRLFNTGDGHLRFHNRLTTRYNL